MQRQFSMPYRTDSLVEQYLRYTCPYDIFMRIEDIRREISRRKIDGLIHYVQSFCFRQIEDPLFKQILHHPHADDRGRPAVGPGQQEQDEDRGLYRNAPPAEGRAGMSGFH